jgi:hypothetical protein
MCLRELLPQKMRHHRRDVLPAPIPRGLYEDTHSQSSGVVWIIGSRFIHLTKGAVCIGMFSDEFERAIDCCRPAPHYGLRHGQQRVEHKGRQ